MIRRQNRRHTERDGANVGPTICRPDSSAEERLPDCMIVIHRSVIIARAALADRLSAPHFPPHADSLLASHVSFRGREDAP